MSEIELKSVGDVLNKEFIIPTYQRGYRWDKTQIEALLNDLCEFHSGKSSSEFYCLQPMIVKRDADNDNAFVVIDGQQRLTTLKMITAFLDGIQDEEKFLSKIQGIEYLDGNRREEGCSESKRIKKIDYIFKKKALKTIRDFSYEKHSIGEIDSFDKTVKERVKFIWYEVDRSVNEHEIFSRLNIGKIPLTNAELLKACFLCDSNFHVGDELTQIQMAAEWDRVELELQDESLWYFFNKKANEQGTRIDAIFNIMYPNKNNNNDDTYYTFRKFYQEKLKNGNAKAAWREVYNLFLQLKEWHDDKKIGGLAWFAIRNGLIKWKVENYKNIDFRNKIKEWLDKAELTDGSNDRLEIKLDGVYYESENIREILELANVCYCAHKEIPFPYEKTLELDIEHISPQNEDLEKYKKDFFASLSAPLAIVDKALAELQVGDFIKRLNSIKEKINNNENDGFSELYEDIKNFPFLSQYVGSLGEYEKNDIGNLTLLSKEINRGYGNSIFTMKRNIIAEKCGEILPLTLCAFSREYCRNKSSNDVEYALHWTKKDVEQFKNYQKDLIEIVLNGEDM